jgi:hypothetical protein
MAVSKRVVVLVAALGVVGVGCGDAKSTAPSEYGQASIALVGTGADGTAYRLPAGSQIELNSGQFDLVQSLDGNGAEIDVAVPPGQYQATLFDANFATPVSWTLDVVDVAGNLIGNVVATLDTAMPVALAVVSGRSTPIALSFRIPTGASVNFDRGSVSVTLSVSTGQATSYAFDASVSLNVSSVLVPGGSPLTGVVAGPGTQGLALEVGGPITGDWVETGGEIGDTSASFLVCAPPNITTKIASGNPAFDDFIAEVGTGSDPLSLFGTASLCVQDDGNRNIVRVRLSRIGAPTTPTFQVLGAGPFQFRVIMQAVLPSRAYDYAGHTLNLAQLMADSGAGLQLLSATTTIFDVANNGLTTEEFGSTYAAPSGETFSFTGQ